MFRQRWLRLGALPKGDRRGCVCPRGSAGAHSGGACWQPAWPLSSLEQSKPVCCAGRPRKSHGGRCRRHPAAKVSRLLNSGLQMRRPVPLAKTQRPLPLSAARSADSRPIRLSCLGFPILPSRTLADPKRNRSMRGRKSGRAHRPPGLRTRRTLPGRPEESGAPVAWSEFLPLSVPKLLRKTPMTIARQIGSLRPCLPTDRLLR